jgi:flotillin
MISLTSLLPILIPMVIIGVILGILAAGYVKAPPDKAYVISGLRKEPKILIGKAGIKIPFLERKNTLDLKLIPIDVKTASTVPTADYINIKVDAVVNVKISNQISMLRLAQENFLDKTAKDIAPIAREVLEGNMREIIGQMRLEEMVSDRQKFADLVKENAGPDLSKLGLEILSFNVQNFIDENQVIENLGVDNVTQISKKAAIARANAEKEINIATAQAAQESNAAQVAADTEIAKRKNELAIQKAELKKQADIKMAEAEAAKGIQAEEQRKTLEITSANANLARQEKEIELKEREVAIKEKTLEAEVKKTAEAQKYAAQQKADAQLYATQKASEAELFERQRKAEADKFESEQEAEAKKATAEAEKFAKEQEAAAVRAQGVAEADAIRAKGEAEAASIKAKAEAEAEGLMKKAEAMAAYGDAAKQDMQLQALKVYFEQLPAIAKAVGEGYSNVDKIVMLGDDSSKLAGNIMGTTTQVSEGLSESLGIDLKSLLAGFMGANIVRPKDVTVNIEEN